MATWTTRALIALAPFALLGCPSGATEALEQEKAALQAEIVSLKAEHAAVTAELAKRPARPMKFSDRAAKIVEVFARCEEPCAKFFSKDPTKIQDKEKNEALERSIGACVAKCM